MKTRPEWLWVDGTLRRYEEVQFGLFTHALNYGTACFAGIRGYWNPENSEMLVFRLSDHVKRFRRSASFLHIEMPTEEVLERGVLDLLAREDHAEDCYIRPLALKSAEVLGTLDLRDLGGMVAMGSFPFGPYMDNDEGAHATISAWRRVSDNAIPARGKLSGAYVNSALVKTDALASGFDEGIVLTEDGHVAEGSAMNLFLVRDGVVVTPRVSDDILEGITRRSAIQLLEAEMQVPVVERQVDRSELHLADEIFLVGTAAQITAVTRLDHRAIGTGETGNITRDLRRLFFAAARGRLERYRHWCTVVETPPLITA